MVLVLLSIPMDAAVPPEGKGAVVPGKGNRGEILPLSSLRLSRLPHIPSFHQYITEDFCVDGHGHNFERDFSLGAGSISGSGTLRSPFIRIAVKEFKFEGTIICKDGVCVISTTTEIDRDKLPFLYIGNLKNLVITCYSQEDWDTLTIGKLVRKEGC